MTEPQLYRHYPREEAIALFGPAEQARSLCDGQWALLPDHILCLTAVGTPPGPSHFRSASRFCWSADKPYRAADGEGWDVFLPREVRAGRERDLPIHLFARGTAGDGYVYLGRLRQSHSWGSGSSGSFGEADFDLWPPLPSRVWAALTGVPREAPDPRALDAALARLGRPLSAQERFGILRQVVDYWHRPIRPEDGIPEAELQGRALPQPLRRWYTLAGRRRGLVDGYNHLLGPGELVHVEGGRVMFLSENQGGYGWATLLEGEDPPVWGSVDGVEPWVEEGMTLGEFLIQASLFEATNTAAPYHASAGLSAEAMARLAAVVPPLPLSPWHWPIYPTRFHVGGGAFLVVEQFGAEGEDRSFSVIAAARTEQPLGRLACVLYRSWDKLDWSPPAVDPSWLAWRDGTVARIARTIRAARRFDDLPVLADAKEEAHEGSTQKCSKLLEKVGNPSVFAWRQSGRNPVESRGINSTLLQ